MHRHLAHADRSSVHAERGWSTPGPCNGRVLCALLAAAAHTEHVAACKSHGRFLPFVSANSPLRVFSAEGLSLCISLLAVPSRTQCSHANAAMYRSPVLFPPAARATPACSVHPSASRHKMPSHAPSRNTVPILWRRRETPVAAQHHHILVVVGLKGKINRLPLPHVNHPSQPLLPVER
jgi:hypothetical protein